LRTFDAGGVKALHDQVQAVFDLLALFHYDAEVAARGGTLEKGPLGEQGQWLELWGSSSHQRSMMRRAPR
jgi:hypothetical protein